MPHPMPSFGSFSLLIALALCAYAVCSGAVALRAIASGPRLNEFVRASKIPALILTLFLVSGLVWTIFSNIDSNIVAAFAFSIFILAAIALAFWAIENGRLSAEHLRETSRRAGLASFVCVTCAAFALVYASYTNDFSVDYILHHTNRALDWKYKFAALWSGQEGSLLLWAWLLAAYGFVLRLRHKVDVTLSAYASTILAAIQVFFLLLLVFAARPFSIVPGGIPPADGFGLNPLLQYPEMVIHPPMLYLGYVGFSVPFAFALGALMMRYPGENWIHITRRWTMIAWLLLTIGISLGMHWAYAVLGWGGYWGWDPVENASFLPWLTGTAFLHSVMMQEKRGMMKRWNVWLIFLTFMLTILGTLLTRSGVVSSVHAFAQSSIGSWFTSFLVLTFAVCAFTFFYQGSHLKSENHLESLVSRESSFLFNNLILLVACFTVLFGTLWPVISEFYDGSKVTMGAPYFNREAVPIGLALIFLTGLGPLLPWRSTSFRAIRRNFILPCIAILFTAAILIFSGVRPWKDDEALPTIYALVCFSLSAGVVTAIFSEFLRGAGVVSTQSGKNIFTSGILLVRRNTRRYGGYLIHFGVIVLFVGLAGSAFNQSKELEMGLGDSIQLSGYKLVCQSFTQDSNPNYDTDYALLDLFHNGKKITQLAPEKRFYTASQQPSTIVAIHSTLSEDVYVVFEGRDRQTDKPIIKVFLNPLVNWIWIGVGIIVFGTFIALVPPLKPVRRIEPVTESQHVPLGGAVAVAEARNV